MTRVSLIFAGWIPQDGTFESERIAGLEIERNQLQCNMISHKTSADHSQSSRTASDQHQPASARTIAALAPDLSLGER